ncbi:methylated-DNA-[protein]-cysteine S-methyltransferase [Chitinophaga sp. S165]|nr:methylated-DNA-[protein]-cysteine S-methyltransferase [Chitinophaga sp. S165]
MITIVNRLVYKDINSPVGKLRLIATGKGLAAVLWEGEDFKRTKLAYPEHEADNPILFEAELQLNDYFNRKRTFFTLPLDCKGTVFQKKVWDTLLDISFGETKTYGQLAEMLGDKNAVRAVGGALNKNPIAIIVPCHRIVGASGKLVGFAGGLKNKSVLLDLERQQKLPDLFNQF